MTDGKRLIALLEIEPEKGHAQALIDYYVQKKVIEAGQKYGLIEGVLTRGIAPSHKADSAPQEERLRVVSIWPEAADYQSWLDSPDRRDLIAGMSSLIDSIDGTTMAGMTLEGYVPERTVVHRVAPLT